jgi:outer membrane protein
MLKRIFIAIWATIFTAKVDATNLIDVFKQALESDPTYLEVVEQTLADNENISISRSALLPSISMQSFGREDFFRSWGASTDSQILPPKSRFITFQPQLSISQVVFNFSQLANLHGAQIASKQANAALNAALQNLMIRVAQAYFNVLNDEENLNYNRASKLAFAKQLSQVRKLYKAGSATKTDVYTAESAYGTADVGFINAQTRLAIDREFLGTITGELNHNLAKLKDHFPLISPNPKKIEQWVRTAKQQNWTIKANTFALQAAKEIIKQHFAGHLPTLNLRLSSVLNTSNSTASSLISASGTTKKVDNVAALNLNVPIFSGGLVVAQTRQAQHNYRVAYQQLQNSYRNTVYTTRQSYLNLVADLAKLRTDKITLQSALSSLDGLKKRYNAGAGNIVDVLHQQEKVLQIKSQIAANRYSYVMNYLMLKNAVGTLNFDDIKMINSWLKSRSEA